MGEITVQSDDEAPDVSPPRVTDGYMSRAAFYEFFAQIYDRRVILDLRAGKLFKRIVIHGSTGTVPFKIRCRRCGKRLKRYEWRPSCQHPMDSVAVSVRSLTKKKNGRQFLESGFRLVGPTMTADFKLLVKSLKKLEKASNCSG